MDTALKILEQDDSTALVGGYGVIFGGRDLEGETFTKDTDFMLDLVPRKLVFVDHSQGSEMEIDGKRFKLAALDDPVGTVQEIRPDDTGLYMELMLTKAGQYWEVVEGIINSGKAGLSTGTVGHLARRDGKNITRWPIVETSLTLTPAEPRTVATVDRLKKVAEANPDLKAILKSGQETAEDSATETDGPKPEDNSEENDMSDNEGTADVAITRDEFDQQMDKMVKRLGAVDTLSERLDAVVSAIEALPETKKAGYVADDDDLETDTKSFGDFLVSVKRGNVKRLKNVYGSTKDMSGTTGGAGGYLVPEDYSTALLRVMEVENQISSRCFNMPVTTFSGQFPTLDVFNAPTAGAGDTALSAGLSPANVAEGAAYGEDQPTFELLRWQVKKIGEIVDVPQELIDDSGIAIETLLTRLFAISIDAKVERHVLRGAGGNEFLGILNSTAAIAVTTASDNAFAAQDVLNMLARFKPMPAGNPVWIMHRGVIADFNNTNFPGNAIDFVEYNRQLPANLMGYPILYSEHSPQDDNAGDVILADLSAYILFNRRQLSISFSEHAKFENDLVVWKYNIRADGMPWMKSAITLADPQGSYTVSPFVYHND